MHRVRSIEKSVAIDLPHSLLWHTRTNCTQIRGGGIIKLPTSFVLLALDASGQNVAAFVSRSGFPDASVIQFAQMPVQAPIKPLLPFARNISALEVLFAVNHAYARL